MAVQGLADKFVFYALNHPKLIARAVAVVTLVVIALAAIPNFVFLSIQ